MQELVQIGQEFLGAWSRVSPKDKKLSVIVAAQFALCILSLAYCVVGMYHQYYKGLICLVGSLAVASTTYMAARYRASPAGVLLVDCIVLFVFVHVMTRKWAYLSNDHDVVNDRSY